MERKTLGFLLLLTALVLLFLLTRAGSTPEIWKLQVPGEILSPPAFDGKALYLFLDAQQLARFDPAGGITHTVALKAPFQFPLEQTTNHLLAIDLNGQTTCYRKADLSVAWTKQSPVQAELSPLALQGDLFLIQKEPGLLLAVDAEKGEVQWEARFSGEVVNIVVDQVLACVHGYTDLKNSEWKISALNPSDGEFLWTYPVLVAEGNPHPIEGLLAFCDASGRPQLVDQLTGEERFQHEKSGYRIFAASQDHLFNLAAGGSIFECINLTTGKSWSANLPSPLTNVLMLDQRIFVVDGKGLRAVKAETGEILWEKELGKTFHAFSLPSGPVVTYKASFTDRVVYHACFNPIDGSVLWVCQDSAMFWQPWSQVKGDLTICRSGSIRLMPLPVAAATRAPSVLPQLPPALKAPMGHPFTNPSFPDPGSFSPGLVASDSAAPPTAPTNPAPASGAEAP